MLPQLDHLARELLTIALCRAGMELSEADHTRLAAELARLLDEGRMISDAVPMSMEPQTMVVFEDDTDAA